MSPSDLFTELLQKPALYIHHGSVIRAEAFIEGYICGSGKTDSIYRDFGQWLRLKFQVRQDLSWASIICFIGGSEAGAFQLAKEMWGKYLDEMHSKNRTSSN